MINDDLLTQVFESIIYEGTLESVKDHSLRFNIKNTYVDIQIIDENEYHEKKTNTPLSIEKLTGSNFSFWNWDVVMNKPIKKGVLFVYYMNTPHNQDIIKPALCKQEEYRDHIQNLLEEYEYNYLMKLLKS